MMKILMVSLLGLAVLVGIVYLLGARLPVRHTASRSARLDAPPEAVWAILTNPKEFTTWRKDLKSTEVLSEGSWVEVDSHHQRITFEVTEARPHERLVTTIADKNLPFGGSWTFELKPAGAGTEITITENGEVRNVLYRFMSRYVFGYTATMEKYLENLKARLAS